MPRHSDPGRTTRDPAPHRFATSYLGAVFAFFAAMAIATSGARGEWLALDGPAGETETAAAIHLVPGTIPPLAYVTDETGAIVWMARWNPAARDFEVERAVCRHPGETSRDERDDLAQNFGFK
jgi:hypothetical protein